MQHVHRPIVQKRLWAKAAAVVLIGAVATSASAAPSEYLNLGYTPNSICRTLIPNAQPRSSSIVSEQISKSSAILGGEPSALERIKLAQNDAPWTNHGTQSVAQADPVVGSGLHPAAGGIRVPLDECSPAAVSSLSQPVESENFLASKRLKIGRTIFDRDWSRVSAQRISPLSYQRLIGAAEDDKHALMATVNRWVNRSIAFTEDRDLFDTADFWAGATITLALRRGDCEDIALTKMELLSAAGIPRGDMILTIAKDLVRNADHAILIVRHEGRFYMLDNASDEVFEASASHDYRPIVSYGTDQAWLHGY